MKKLGVVFAKKQRRLIEETAIKIGTKKSKVARAAMFLGLEIIGKKKDNATEKEIQDYISLNNFKSMGD